MSKRKSRQRRQAVEQTKPQETPSPPSTPPLGDLLERISIGAMAGLLVITQLFPCDSVGVRIGQGVMLAVAWLVLWITWMLASLLQPTYEIRFGWTGALLTLFLLAHSLSAVVLVLTGDGYARPALNVLWQWVSFGAVFFLARQMLRTETHCRALCVVMIAMAVCLSAHGYAQYFYEDPLQRERFENASEEQREEMFREAGLEYAAPDSPLRKHFYDRLNSREPRSTFALTNSLAGYLAPWLIVALGIGLTSWGTDKLRYPTLISAVCWAMVIGGCLFLTKSRTAWIAIAVGLLLLAVYGRAKGMRVGWKIPATCAGVVAILAIGAFFVGGLDIEVLTESSLALRYRFEYWQSTCAMIADYPLVGCGLGNFKELYTAYKLPQASEAIADPHNFVLEVWATAGTPALIALVALLVGFGWQLRRASARTHDAAPPSKSNGKESNRGIEAIATVYIGAVGSVALVYAGLWALGEPPAPAILFVGLPAAVACGASLHPWVVSGKLSIAPLAIAVIVLLGNLLAQGGIGYPGVAQSLWLLMALALNVAEPNSAAVSAPRVVALVILLFAGALSMLCYQTAYGPVLNVKTQLSRAEDFTNGGRYGAADDVYAEAAQADPFATEPWQRRAALWLGRWMQTQKDKDFAQFEKYIDEYQQRNPKSSSVCRVIAEYYMLAYHASEPSDELRLALDSSNLACDVHAQIAMPFASWPWVLHRLVHGEQLMEEVRYGRNQDYVAKAVHWYREAVRRYPNNSFLHAQLAWAYALSGEREEAAKEANMAMKLDELNPHEEHDLSQQRIFTGGQVPQAETAEQLMLTIRKAKD